MLYCHYARLHSELLRRDNLSSHSLLINLNCFNFDGGVNQSSWRKLTQTQREHSNVTQDALFYLGIEPTTFLLWANISCFVYLLCILFIRFMGFFRIEFGSYRYVFISFFHHSSLVLFPCERIQQGLLRWNNCFAFLWTLIAACCFWFCLLALTSSSPSCIKKRIPAQ